MKLLLIHTVLKENQPRMWEAGKYELVIPGRPTRARRVSVGRPGITSEYLPASYIRGLFSFYYIYAVIFVKIHCKTIQ